MGVVVISGQYDFQIGGQTSATNDDEFSPSGS